MQAKCSECTIELFGRGGDPFAIVLGLPGARLVVPGIVGGLWLDVNAPILPVGTRLIPADRRARTNLTVPAVAGLAGIAFRFQALIGTTWSNPATHVQD